MLINQFTPQGDRFDEYLHTARITVAKSNDSTNNRVDILKFDLARAVRAAIADFESRGVSFSAWDVTQSISDQHRDQAVLHHDVKPTTHSLMKRLIDSGRFTSEV